MEYNEAVSADRKEHSWNMEVRLCIPHPYPRTPHTHTHTHSHTLAHTYTHLYTCYAFLTCTLTTNLLTTHTPNIPTGRWWNHTTLSLHTHTPNDSKSSPTDWREVMALHTRLGSFWKSQYCVGRRVKVHARSGWIHKYTFIGTCNNDFETWFHCSLISWKRSFSLSHEKAVYLYMATSSNDDISRLLL